MTIKDEILKKLHETEESYEVKIPIAIESGSRGWGFHSPDSDYDCRFIYVHKKDWYLSVLEKKDFIEYAVDEIYDINGWDLTKVLKHIMKSNAVMLEWLMSNEVYIKDLDVSNILLDLAKQYFKPVYVSYHYLNMCKNKLSEVKENDETKLKTYFYILRPIACILYVDKYCEIPYMEYQKNLDKIDVPSDVLNEINNLLTLKATVNESYKIPKNDLLVNYFETVLEATEEKLKTKKNNTCKDYANVDIAFRKILELVWDNE